MMLKLGNLSFKTLWNYVTIRGNLYDYFTNHKHGVITKINKIFVHWKQLFFPLYQVTKNRYLRLTFTYAAHLLVIYHLLAPKLTVCMSTNLHCTGSGSDTIKYVYDETCIEVESTNDMCEALNSLGQLLAQLPHHIHEPSSGLRY